MIELERERVQLLFQIDPIVPDQPLDSVLLISKPLRTMQSVLNMEPGKRLDLAAQVIDNCLSFHIGPSPACCGCRLSVLPFSPGCTPHPSFLPLDSYFRHPRQWGFSLLYHIMPGVSSTTWDFAEIGSAFLSVLPVKQIF
jgi:hypothetical protein